MLCVIPSCVTVRLLTHPSTQTHLHTHRHTAIVWFVFPFHLSFPLSLLSFYSALILCLSLRCYLMELCCDVRCYVRWQQSRQVKATLSSLETTCELPACSLALFFLPLLWSLAWLFLLSLTPCWLYALFQMSDRRPVADKRWRWLQSEAWTNGAGGWWEKKFPPASLPIISTHESPDPNQSPLFQSSLNDKLCPLPLLHVSTPSERWAIKAAGEDLCNGFSEMPPWCLRLNADFSSVLISCMNEHPAAPHRNGRKASLRSDFVTFKPTDICFFHVVCEGSFRTSQWCMFHFRCHYSAL